MFRKILLTLLFFVVSPVETLAQSPGHLRENFEGKYVVVKINMPATKDGVDLRADRLPRIDQRKYRNKLRRAGTSVEQGEAIKLTFIKVKKKLIEVHLGAGGYGSQYVRKVVYPAAPMTEQEVNLEAELATVGEEYPEVKKVSPKRGGRFHSSRSYYTESRHHDRGHAFSHRKAHKRAHRRHRRLHRRDYRRHGHYHGGYYYQDVYHHGCDHYRVYGHHDFRHGHHGDRHHHRHRGRIFLGVSIPF